MNSFSNTFELGVLLEDEYNESFKPFLEWQWNFSDYFALFAQAEHRWNEIITAREFTFSREETTTYLQSSLCGDCRLKIYSEYLSRCSLRSILIFCFYYIYAAIYGYFSYLILQGNIAKPLQHMIGTSPDRTQCDAFRPLLTDFIDPDHRLVLLADAIDWNFFEAKFEGLYSDTSVQENNTTFPTDAKLAKKVIDACNRIARAEGAAQRQSYVRVSKQLLRDSYNASHPRRAKKAKKTRKKLPALATCRQDLRLYE